MKRKTYANFRDWYIHFGSKRLDFFLQDLVGRGLGDVPVENVLEGVPHDLAGYSPETFAKLLSVDGLTAKLVKEGAEESVYITIP